MNFIGTKQLETERLILRKATFNDAIDAFNNWCSSDVVSKYVMWEKHKSLEETKLVYSKWMDAYKEMDTFRWVVLLKETKELIGSIDVSKKFLNFGTCEIGYCYGEKFWNHGSATEIFKRVIEFLFEEVDADIIVGEHMSNNPASGKVMMKAGLKYETKLRCRVNDKFGEKNDLIVYSITKGEYYKEKCNG